MPRLFTEYPESVETMDICLGELVSQVELYKADRAAYAKARRNIHDPNYMAVLDPLYLAYLTRVASLKEAHAEYKTAFRNLRQCKQL